MEEFADTFTMACGDVAPDVVAIPTVFSFSYAVELDQRDVSLSFQTREELPTRISNAAVETVANRLCQGNTVQILPAGRRSLEESKDNHRALAEHHKTRRELEESRRFAKELPPCFVSVVSGPKDVKVRSGCNLYNSRSQTCTIFLGALEVMHTNECSRGQVREATNMALRMGVEKDEFLDLVNNKNGLTEATGVSLTRVDIYTGDLFPSAEIGDFAQESKAGLSKAESIIVSVSVVGAFLAILLFILWRRRVVSRLNKMDEQQCD